MKKFTLRGIALNRSHLCNAVQRLMLYVELSIQTLLLIFFWNHFYNASMPVPIYYRGYYALALFYWALLFICTKALKGRDIGDVRVFDTIVSQSVALLLGNVASYFPLCLLSYRVLNPSWLLVMTLLQTVLIVLWCFLCNRLFFYLFRPLELLLIGLIRRDRDAPETPPAAPRRAGETSLAPSIGAASYFSDAARYVERNLDTSLDLKTVCAVSGVSPAQLERLCRKATGMSFIQFCRARRIRRARELIREGRLNLTAIAAATGFSSIHYFSRTFKSVMGMSPSEYLKSVRSMADKPAD